MPYAIDLHTHSVASPDGSLHLQDYQSILQQGRLQYVAITDHNTIQMAQQIQAALGEQVIVGEEISTTQGEIIGLYLTAPIAPMLSPLDTVQAIEAQGGLVYIPHPFETVRKGLTVETLQSITDHVDIIEVHNGRAIFQNFSEHALAWARSHNVPGAASSDAHGQAGWGRTCSVLEEPPTRETLTGLLGRAELRRGFIGARGLMYPKFNRLRKRFS